MKLSGHTYQNDVFDSLLDGLKSDVVLKKEAKKEQPPVSSTDVFSSTTKDVLRSIREDEMRTMASELEFAAEKAKLAVSGADLLTFASQAKGLKGKKLERAAQKFCNQINREIQPPQSATKVGGISLIDQLSPHLVTPAGYPEDQIGDRKTGGYLGMSKNPNTVWDSDALQRFAARPELRKDMLGDEQMADTKLRQANKPTPTPEEIPEEVMINKKHVLNASTGQEAGTSQQLPENAMSIFSGDRDFNNIPEKTAGEMLKEQAEERKQKSAEAKGEWNKTVPAKKADNAGTSFFEEIPRSSVERAKLDTMFEGLIDVINKKKG